MMVGYIHTKEIVMNENATIFWAEGWKRKLSKTQAKGEG